MSFMGAVQVKLGKTVALKVLSPGSTQDPRALARFEREMKAVGRLNHPNIVQALDAREIEGTPILVMEYVEGMDFVPPGPPPRSSTRARCLRVGPASGRRAPVCSRKRLHPSRHQAFQSDTHPHGCEFHVARRVLREDPGPRAGVVADRPARQGTDRHGVRRSARSITWHPSRSRTAITWISVPTSTAWAARSTSCYRDMPPLRTPSTRALTRR